MPFAYSICRTDSGAKRVGASSFVYWIRKQVVHTEWVSSGRIKAPDTAVFCTVHQSTEQWLKLVCFEARTANEKVQKGGLEARAGGLFRVRSLQDSAQPNPAAGKIRFAVLKHRKRF